jgi:hypothetical protein
MPTGFSWCTIDVTDPAQVSRIDFCCSFSTVLFPFLLQVNEMYTLLTENYVEDDECMFR